MCYEWLALYTCGLKYVHLYVQYVTLNVIRGTSGDGWVEQTALEITSPANGPFVVGVLHYRLRHVRPVFPQPGMVQRDFVKGFRQKSWD